MSTAPSYTGLRYDSPLSRGSRAPAATASESSSPAPALCIAFGAAALLGLMLAGGLGQLSAAIYVGCVLLLLAFLRPTVCILSTFVFLAVMGDFRRLLIVDISRSFDPVLVVGPAVAATLAGLAWMKGRLNRDLPIAKMAIALTGLMILQIFNPLQGGLMVGILGTLFYLVPVLWFWIGQSWGSTSFVENLLFRVVVPVSILACPLALYQAFVGVLPFEDAAYESVTHAHIVISGTMARPMSFFVSTSEFAQFVTIALAALLAALFARRRGLLTAVPAVLFILAALFFSSCRGPIVTSLAVGALLWGMISQNLTMMVARIVVAGTLAVMGLVWGLHQAQDVHWSPQVASLVKHQTDGLLDPTNGQKSSANGHFSAIFEGFTYSVLHAPLGKGLGATSMAAGKFDEAIACTEIDFSDMSVAIGPIGGLIYLVFTYKVLRGLGMRWRQLRDPTALLLLAGLAVTLGRWSNGSQYSVAALCWFFLGASDRLMRSGTNLEPSALPSPAPTLRH